MADFPRYAFPYRFFRVNAWWYARHYASSALAPVDCCLGVRPRPLFVSCPVAAVGLVGSLGAWRLRLVPPPPDAPGVADPRLLLIGITEQDIRQQAQWPLSDATVAQLLHKVLAARPRAIGLD